MELRQLKYFVVVAEELHFGRAAERLYIAQSPLSRQIRSLERELGAALLRRTTRHVELTSAGKTFLDEARLIIAAVDGAAKKVSQIGAAPRRAMRLTFTDCAALALLGRAVRLIKNMYGDVSIDLQTGLLTPKQLERLLEDRSDVAFIIRPKEVPAGVEICTLLSEPLVLLVPEASPLAARESLYLHDLHDQHLISFPGEGQSVVRTIFEEACHAEGFNPKIPHTAHDLKSIIDLVRAGLGSAPMPASVGNDSYPGIVIKPLADSPMVEVAMASREGEDHTPAGQVVASMRRQLAGSSTARTTSKEASPGRGRTGHESIHDASVRAPIPASVS